MNYGASYWKIADAIKERIKYINTSLERCENDSMVARNKIQWTIELEKLIKLNDFIEHESLNEINYKNIEQRGY